MRGRAAWHLYLLLWLPGCAREIGPAETLRRFAHLVVKKRDADAYLLMGPSFREQCDLECFQRLLRANRGEIERLHESLRAGRVEVELRSALSGLPFELRRSGRSLSWRIHGDPLDFYPQGTPAAALRSFVRAVEGRRYRVLMRFLPEKLSEKVTEEALRAHFEGPKRRDLARQLDAVKRHLEEPFLVDGNSARLPLGERREVRLVLENGSWKVLELE